MEIRINDVYKSYGKKEVLKGVSFAASSGKCIGILGGNGCGKSTLIKMILDNLAEVWGSGKHQL